MLSKREVTIVYQALFGEPPDDNAEIKQLMNAHDDVGSLRAALMKTDKFVRAIGDVRPAKESYIGSDGFVDANKLADAFSLEEHQKNADTYFANISDPWQYHLRKPYAEVNECCQILVGLSAIFKVANLLPGQRVLDFGCGTGWLSQILASLRCRAVGLDVSAAAIKIAEGALASHPIRDQLGIEFAVFDGRQLPFGEGSFDRIICFDSFHHVPDQDFAIKEFGRLLKPGGIAVFHEPGPTHSSSPQSQHEMKNYRVIENDIIVERLWAVASACGFESMKLAMNAQQPFIFPLEDFNAALTGGQPPAFFENLGRTIVSGFIDKRIFALKKRGDELSDSRSRAALRGEIIVRDVSYDPERRDVRAKLTLRNTGTATWRPSGAELGSVNLGVRLFHLNGDSLDANYSRHEILSAELPPGSEATVEIGFHVRYEIDRFVMEFDLVSELVAWFSELGCAMPRVEFGPSGRI